MGVATHHSQAVRNTRNPLGLQRASAAPAHRASPRLCATGMAAVAGCCSRFPFTAR
jgi:hypothetical protein